MNPPDGPRDWRRRRFVAAAATAPVLIGLRSPTASAADPGQAGGRFDVRQHGALGDAKADDTAAIQAAIDAAGERGGGEVAFPAGTFRTRTLRLRSRVHLVGAGPDATILQLAPGTDDDLIQTEGFRERTGTGDPGGPYNFSIRGMTLDGNRSRNRRGSGLRIYGYGYLLGDLRIRSCAEAGLYSEWATAGMVGTGDSMEAQVVNLKVHDCGAGGIVFRGPHDSQFVNGIVYDGTTFGIQFDQGSKFSAVGCQFVNGHVWGHHEVAWKLDADYVTLVNCMGEWASSAQVHVNRNDATILGGRFFGDPEKRHVGIAIGSADRVVYGTQVDARMSDLVGGAFQFTNEGGSSQIRALIYQSKGEPYRGSPAETSRLDLAVNGIEGGSTANFSKGPLSWNGGTPIRRHLSGTAPWSPPVVAQGAAAWTEVAVPGSALGDTVAVGFDRPLPPGTLLAGSVSAPETVTVTLLNHTGRPLRVEPGRVRADCWGH